MGRWLQERFAQNPIAWLLLAGLLFVEYWNWQHGAQITELCSYLDVDSEAFVASPAIINPGRIQTICASRDGDPSD